MYYFLLQYTDLLSDELLQKNIMYLPIILANENDLLYCTYTYIVYVII